MTERELRTIVDVSHEEGVIEEDEKDMINNVFDLGDAKAKEVMVPRVRVIMADIDSSYEDLIEIFREEQFTRIPIYKDSIDNIVGLVNMKDLLLYRDFEHFKIEDILRKPYFTYENKPVSELLLEMKNAAFNLAIVMDEYGEMAGIIRYELLWSPCLYQSRTTANARKEIRIHYQHQQCSRKNWASHLGAVCSKQVCIGRL